MRCERESTRWCTMSLGASAVDMAGLVMGAAGYATKRREKRKGRKRRAVERNARAGQHH